MNTAPVEVRMCVGKAAYTKKMAQTVARARNRGARNCPSNKRRHVADRPVRAYQCDYCDYWHLTSSED